jgi:hypothetical protein
MQRSRKLLERRIGELDTAPLWSGASEIQTRRDDWPKTCSLIVHFADIMSGHTDSFMDCEAGHHATIDPGVADEMTASCRLLKTLAAQEPGLTKGPMRVDRQHWIATGSRAMGRDGMPLRPSESNFVEPCLALIGERDVQPFHLGLYTSTAASCGWSMWRAYLAPYGNSSLYPLPWCVWGMEPAQRKMRVAEIGSAAQWVDFVCARPSVREGNVYPNWTDIAREFDAVHVSLLTIVAAQGFHFRTSEGVIPPAFWDVETTFWLKWCFEDAKMVELVKV